MSSELIGIKPVGISSAFDWIVDMAMNVPGWRAGMEAKALARAAYDLGERPILVEVGAYMGRSTLLMAGARRLRGGGIVHCVDPFDCSGDDFSVPFYLDGLARSGAQNLEDVFRSNIKLFGLECMVAIHKGTSREIAARWQAPIDLVLLDADHSRDGAREAFESWTPFLKRGGVVILDNTSEREYAPTHDGNYRLAKERLKLPHFENVYSVGGATFATCRTGLPADTKTHFLPVW